MGNKTNEEPNEWSKLFDDLKFHKNITSDAKLAEFIGVSPSFICSVRKGRKNPSLDLAKEILAHLGRSFDVDLIKKLFLPMDVKNHAAKMKAIYDVIVYRDNGTCLLCEVKPQQTESKCSFLEIHHIEPFEKGGEEVPENLATLCPNCHKMMHLNPKEENINFLKHRIKESS